MAFIEYFNQAMSSVVLLDYVMGCVIFSDYSLSQKRKVNGMH